jgi:hypothetical protein
LRNGLATARPATLRFVAPPMRNLSPDLPLHTLRHVKIDDSLFFVRVLSKKAP